MPTPKIEVPQLPHGHIYRGQLSRRLPGGRNSSATKNSAPAVALVCAPPGFGKTTLLADWARRRRNDPAGRRTAWVTLDEHDNAPGMLWSALLAALGNDATHPRRPGEPSLPPTQPELEMQVIADLAELVDSQPTTTCLVLDELHVLQERDAWHGLELLLRFLPSKLRLILLSRVEPPLPLHRLRVSGHLLELRADDLTFSSTETAAVLRGHGVTLSDENLTKLMGRTEGWPVSVRLAALTLNRSGDHRATIESFVETDRGVSDYLVSEVFSQLPPDVYDFLLRTSVCDQFTGDLAGQLIDTDDVSTLLTRLERSGSLVSTFGRNGEWYRYPALLLDYLRVVHWRRSPTQAKQLHRTAATWFAEHGEPLTALRLSVAGRCDDMTAELVATHGPALVLRGKMSALRRLATVMAPEILARPEVCLMLTLADLADGARAAAEMRMSGLAGNPEIAHDERLRDLWLVVLIHHARLTGRMAPEVAELGGRIERIADPALRTLALLNQGTLYIWLDDYRGAAEVLERARQLSSELRFDYAMVHCLSHLAALFAIQGDYAETQRAANRAIRFATEHGIARSAACSVAYTSAAWAAFQSLDEDGLIEYSRLATRSLGTGNDRTAELTTRSIAALAELAGNPHTALVSLRAYRASVDPGKEPFRRTLIAAELIVEQQLSLRLGKLDWAAEAADRAATWLGGAGDVLLLQARLYVHLGRAGSARTLLEKITDGTAECVTANATIEANVLAAVLADRAGDGLTAHLRLVAALEEAAPRRALRPFFDGGQDVRELLATQLGRLGQFEGFAMEVLDTITPASFWTTAELTPREIQLLRELPSMGTIKEIASSLYVSVNTVKTHLRSVYRKLGVTSRRAAVLTARRSGLL